MAIVDTEAALELLKLTSPTKPEEAVLEAICDQISDAVEDYCGRIFELSTFTEDYDGSGTRNLMLRQYPIDDIATVTRTKADAANTQVTIVSAEYTINDASGILLMHPVNHVDSAVWIKGEQNYEIVYDAGYDEDDMPQGIVSACSIWIATLFQKAKHNLFAVQSSTIGDETVNYTNDGMPPMTKSMLTKHRKLG